MVSSHPLPAQIDNNVKNCKGPKAKRFSVHARLVVDYKLFSDVFALMNRNWTDTSCSPSNPLVKKIVLQGKVTPLSLVGQVKSGSLHTEGGKARLGAMSTTSPSQGDRAFIWVSRASI